MKNRIQIAIIIIIVLVSIKANAWNVIKNDLYFSMNSVYFLDENTGFLAGGNGMILKTTDGGITWNQQNSGITKTLSSVFFINANNGFVVGAGPTSSTSYILKTMDGGQNWTTQTVSCLRLFSVYFTDLNNGYAVGRSGKIFKTTDAGNSWVEQVSGITETLKSVYFTDTNTGYAAGGRTILKTSDGGITWNTVAYNSTSLFSSISFPDSNTGYVGNLNGTIFKTSDAGLTWSECYTGFQNTAVFFTDSVTGFSANNTILKTTDGGLTWKQQATYMFGCTSLFFVNDSIGFAAGNKVLKTLIGGGYPDNEIVSASNIKARFNTKGNLFYDNVNSTLFEVPKGSGKMTMLAGALWVGGKDSEGHEHVAADRYSAFGQEYSPGPIMNAFSYSQEMEKWNRIWRISRNEVENHILHWSSSGYNIPYSILNWPGNGDTTKGMTHDIAPYNDYNGDGNYTPLQGDYPLIKGDEAIFYVLNDSIFNHEESGGKKMGIEIHVMAYAFNCPNDSALWNTIFLNYEILNKSQLSYDSTFIGIFMDSDIGEYTDDYIGCDVERGSFYTYNGDSLDGDGLGLTYGTHPPAQSVTFLGGPYMNDDGSDFGSSGIPDGCDESINGLNFNDGIVDNERLGMSFFLKYYMGPYPNDWPGPNYYNLLKGIWVDRYYSTYGGTGFSTIGIPAKFMFPGDPSSDLCGWGTNGIPQSGWSEDKEHLTPSNRAGIASMGPFTMLPGSVHNVDLAFVFGRDYVNPDNLASLAVMQQRIDSVRKAFITQKTPCGNFGIGIKENKIKEQITLFPNPANSYFDVKTESNAANNTLKIYSIEGALVKKTSFTGNQTRIFTDKLSNGLYVVEIKSNNNVQYKKVIVTK